MDPNAKMSVDGDSTCDHQAECIRLTGRSDVFRANMVKCDKDGLVLVSPRFAKQGTYLIVRMRHTSPADTCCQEEYIRSTGLTEVRWVEEVIDADGLTYKMGLKYI